MESEAGLATRSILVGVESGAGLVKRSAFFGVEPEVWRVGSIGSSGTMLSSRAALRTGDSGLGSRSSKGFLSVSVYGVRISAGWGSQSDLDGASGEFGVFLDESSLSSESMFVMRSRKSRKSGGGGVFPG